MTVAASTTPTAPTALQTTKNLTIDDVWAALPSFFKRENNPIMTANLDNAAPKLAAATYAHLFWDKDELGRPYRIIPVERLLDLMLVLYAHKGGNDIEAERAFWQRIFKIEEPAA